MNRKYKVVGAVAVDGVDPGDTLTAEFTPGEEADHVAGGRLEILPSSYEVIGSSPVFEHEQGDTFEIAIPLDQEAALIVGGHIRPVTKKAAAAKKSTLKEAK